MKKGTTKITLSSKDKGATHVSHESKALESVIVAMRLLKRLGGILLGSIAVSTQVGNVFICLCMILAGPAFIIEQLIR